MLITKKLLDFDFEQPPVVFGRTIYKTISRVSGIKDIFEKEKIRIEKQLIRYTSFFEKVIDSSKDPLQASAKASCAANAIDFGAGRIPKVEHLFSQLKRIKLDVDDYSIFKRKLKKAKLALIIGDNCGEAFFDKLFIEKMLELKTSLKVFFATRSAPVINDVVLADAARIGIGKKAEVISSGCDYPGIILSKTSARFKNIYRRADIVISKGQGNFESLADRNKDIFYLFKIKCPAVSDHLNLPENSLLFIHNKHIPK